MPSLNPNTIKFSNYSRKLITIPFSQKKNANAIKEVQCSLKKLKNLEAHYFVIRAVILVYKKKNQFFLHSFSLSCLKIPIHFLLLFCSKTIFCFRLCSLIVEHSFLFLYLQQNQSFACNLLHYYLAFRASGINKHEAWNLCGEWMGLFACRPGKIALEKPSLKSSLENVDKFPKASFNFQKFRSISRQTSIEHPSSIDHDKNH